MHIIFLILILMIFLYLIIFFWFNICNILYRNSFWNKVEYNRVFTLHFWSLTTWNLVNCERKYAWPSRLQNNFSVNWQNSLFVVFKALEFELKLIWSWILILKSIIKNPINYLDAEKLEQNTQFIILSTFICAKDEANSVLKEDGTRMSIIKK